jgi:hypothetical protein
MVGPWPSPSARSAPTARSVAHALKGRRDEVTLATKCGLVVVDAQTLELGRDGTPAHIHEAIDGSLRRLEVDQVDLYYLHRPDPAVAIEESVGALKEIVEAGKAKHIGLSEVTRDELERAHAIHPITAVQTVSSSTTTPVAAGRATRRRPARSRSRGSSPRASTSSRSRAPSASRTWRRTSARPRSG